MAELARRWPPWPSGPGRPSSPSRTSAAAPSRISNLGAVGGTYSTPIINHPEVAILLLGRARLAARWFAARTTASRSALMLPLSLSYDHRLVDGAAAGRFLNEVIDYLQARQTVDVK